MVRKPQTDIERQLEAMERDTLAACNRVPPEQAPSWDKTVTLTAEQKEATAFVSVARRAWVAGKGYWISWLWDRYCDGVALSEAYSAVAKKKGEEARADAQGSPLESRTEEQPRGPVKAGAVAPD